jgi:hypothetical protein
MYVIGFLALALICSVISIIRKRKELSAGKIVDTCLFYLLFFNVGLTGLFSFYGHAFLADKVAVSIGWATGSPFQFEVALTNLAFGLLGLLCIRFKDGFWLATGLGYAVFLFGAAFGHIRQIQEVGNHSINNGGPILYLGDIFIPALIVVLLLVKWNRKTLA